MIAYALADAELIQQCRTDHFRSSGPGGQHAAKNATAVRLTHVQTGVTATCGTHRDRLRNQAEALQRLRLRLACGLRGGAERGWLDERRQGSRLPVRSGAKGYHLVIGVLLDVLEDVQGVLADLAGHLDLTTSQIVKVLGDDAEVRRATESILTKFDRPPIRWR